MDTESERVVQAALDALLKVKRRSTIVIAHRLVTVKGADKIVVLGEGRVVEKGTHDQLIRIEGGHYRNLVQASSAAAPAEVEEP